MDQEKINNFKIKKASFFAVSVSITLCVLKYYVYKITNSCSLHAGMMDSFMDTVISLINLFAIYMLSIKKSNLAPFGWDKICVLVTTLQCCIISFLSIEIIHESFEKLYYKENHINNFENIFIVSSISFLISLALVLYQKKVVRETNSLIIKADMIHFISDIYSNVFLFIGFIFIKLFNVVWVDAILGIMVSFYLICSVIQLLKTSIFALLDLNYSDEQNRIINVLKQHNYQFSLDDIQVFFSGAKFIVNINISKDLIDQADLIRNVLKDIFVNENGQKKQTLRTCNHVIDELNKTKTMKINIILA